MLKRLPLIALCVVLLGAEECTPPEVPPPPPPGRSPYCYGDYTFTKKALDKVDGVVDAIFGGEESTDRRATLRIQMGSSRCTGVALGPQTAATVAHCVRNATEATAALGQWGVPPFWHMTGKDIHPDADLAIVWYENGDRDSGKPLAEPYVSDIFDPLNREHASKCVRFIAQGWGRWEGGTLSLRECTYGIDRIANDGQLYMRDHGPDECRICYGDSGGPLYAEMEDGSLMLAGLTAGTWNDCKEKSSHTALEPRREWVEERIK